MCKCLIVFGRTAACTVCSEYLDRVVEEDVECVAGAVRDELLGVVGHHLAAVLQLDAHGVVRRAVAGPVHAEAHDEDAAVHAELDAVAPPAVAPLVGPVRRGLEPVY